MIAIRKQFWADLSARLTDKVIILVVFSPNVYDHSTQWRDIKKNPLLDICIIDFFVFSFCGILDSKTISIFKRIFSKLDDNLRGGITIIISGLSGA